MTLPPGTETGHRTVVDERPFTLEADRAFLGCLMQTPVSEARRLLAGVRPDDARSPHAQLVLYLAIHLVTRQIKADPVVLLNTARNQGWLAGEQRHEQFAQWLIDTYRAAPVPQAAPVLKRDMLEGAFRLAVNAQAQRVLDLAAHGQIDCLREWATFDTDRIADLWQRYADAAQAITPTLVETSGTGQISARSERLSGHEQDIAPSPSVQVKDAACARSAPAAGAHNQEQDAA